MTLVIELSSFVAANIEHRLNGYITGSHGSIAHTVICHGTMWLTDDAALVLNDQWHIADQLLYICATGCHNLTVIRYLQIKKNFQNSVKLLLCGM